MKITSFAYLYTNQDSGPLIRVRKSIKCLLLLSCLLFFVPTAGEAQVFPVLQGQHFIGRPGDDVPTSMALTSDGNLILGGMTIRPRGLVGNPRENKNIWIVKVDTLGKVIWERAIEIDGNQELRDLACSSDGGVVFVGVSSSLLQHEELGGPEYGADFLIGKIDSSGITEWIQTFGGKSQDQANGVVEGPYKEYVVVGGSHSNHASRPPTAKKGDVWFLKVDTKGNKRYDAAIGGINQDWATSITVCRDGDYLVAGYTNSPDTTAGEVGMYGNGLLMRLDPTGNIRWQKVFPCRKGGYFSDVVESTNGEILVCGNQKIPGEGRQFWWMVLSKSGELLHEVVMGDSHDEYLVSASAIQEGGFLLGGYSIYTHSGKYAKGGEDFWLIRVDLKGKVLWKNTYGGPNNERCFDVLSYKPGVFFALGEKANNFAEEESSRGKDFWLLRVEEYPCSAIDGRILMQTRNFQVNYGEKLRFKARYRYADHFLWDFGDGTTSNLEKPLKTYPLPGMYQVGLTIFVNESCKQTARLSRPLEVR